MSHVSHPIRRPLLLLLVAAVFLGACSDSPTGLVSASITNVALADPPTALVQALDVELDGSAFVEVDYWTAGGPRLRVLSAEASTAHEMKLHRLRAATTYDFLVTPVGPGGARGASTGGRFSTEPPPAELAAIEAHTVGEATFPLLLMEVSLPAVTGVPVVMDRDGFIVWYRPGTTARTHGIAVLPDVGFAINALGEGVEVVTPDNEVIASLTQADAAARTGLGRFHVHHDIIQGSDDTLLLLVQDTSTVGGTVWTGEAIWEWDFVSDLLEKRWSSFDFMSPATDVGARPVPTDWLHANSLSIGPRGNVLMSLFWTHEVISIAPDYQSLEWRLGGPGSTFTVKNGAMEAGQHTAAEIETDRVLLFDNGLDRPGGELFSRASELQLDRTTNTAEIVWEYRPFPTTYAPIVGSARRLENGNTVINFGVSESGVGRFSDTGPVAVYEATPAGEAQWIVYFEGIDLLYRSTPLHSLGGEAEIMDP